MDVSKLISILSNINAKKVVITSSNGKLAVCSWMEGVDTYAEVDSNITLPQIMVNVEQLSEALKRAEGGELALTYSESESKLTLKTDNMSFGMSVEECNITIPIIPCDDCFEAIDFEGLKTAFTKTVGAVSKDKIRPQLNAVYIDGNRVMATDGRAMSVYELEQVPETFKDKKFTLSSDFISHILKVGKKERTANIYLTKDLFYLRLGDSIFICQRGEPFKMDYERILRESLQADHNALITTDDLKKALKTLKPTLKQTGNQLDFSFQENKTTLKAGDFTLDIVCSYESEPRKVTLNSKYLEVFLQTAGATMEIMLKNESAPVVLTTGDRNYTFVVMPMR